MTRLLPAVAALALMGAAALPIQAQAADQHRPSVGQATSTDLSARYWHHGHYRHYGYYRHHYWGPRYRHWGWRHRYWGPRYGYGYGYPYGYSYYRPGPFVSFGVGPFGFGVY